MLDVSYEIFRALSQIITGRLFTERQVRSITANVFGSYFADLLPTSAKEVELETRITAAREHITAASRIVFTIQDELEVQTLELSSLIKTIEEKKKLAKRYTVLADANQEIVMAYKAELAETLRRELVEQSEKGKYIRLATNVVVGLFTLIAGAALGAYFTEIVAWIISILT